MMRASFGFGEMPPGPEEEKKPEIPSSVRGLEDAAAEALSREAEKPAEMGESDITAPKAAEVPAFIPRNVEQGLADLGYGADERKSMAPERAQEILAAQIRSKEVAPTKPPETEPEVKPKTYVFRFDEKGKAYEETEKSLEREAEKLRDEFERTPQRERERIGVGLRNLGFHVEEKKNLFFAETFKKIAGAKTAEKSVTAKFLGKLGTRFEEDAHRAHDRMVAIEKTKNRETLANAGYLVGNAVKLWTLASGAITMPLRAIAMGGMAFARGADAAKEVRFENEKVIEKTRIEDVEKAAEEAWAVYLAAQNKDVESAFRRYQEAEKRGDQKEIGDAWARYQLAVRDAQSKNVTAKDLEKAYREQLPKDILQRLEAKTPEQPSVANRVVQGFVKWHIERSVRRLEGKISKIEGNEKLTAKEKSAKRERLMNRFERRLRDYDRAVGQFGTVDALAMGLRYAEITGKAVTYAPAIYVAADKVFGALGEIIERGEIAEAWDELTEWVNTAAGKAGRAVGKFFGGGGGFQPSYLFSQGELQDAIRESAAGEAPELKGKIIEHLKEEAASSVHAEAAEPATMGGGESAAHALREGAPSPSVGAESIELATVGKGEGVTHALVRQLKVNPEAFGYDPKSGVDVEQWAILKSKEIAIENGYIKPDGTEIRVLDEGPKGNPAYLLEKDASGKLKVTEYWEGKPTGGAGAKSAYEYEWKKSGIPSEIKPIPVKGGLEAVNELPARQALEAAASGTPDELSVRGPMEVMGAKEVAAPVWERVEVGKLPETKFPEWLTERIEYAKLAETLPEKTANLEHLSAQFENYSLRVQENTLHALEDFEKQLNYLEKHSELLGLTPSQEDFIEMSKEAIDEMRESLEEAEEAFREQLEDVGVSPAAYEKAIVKPGLTIKQLFEMAEKKELDTKKWGTFANWVYNLRPTLGEQGMKVDEFLKSLTPENFRVAAKF